MPLGRRSGASLDDRQAGWIQRSPRSDDRHELGPMPDHPRGAEAIERLGDVQEAVARIPHRVGREGLAAALPELALSGALSVVDKGAAGRPRSRFRPARAV
jgi:hypothetical protein